MSVINLQLVVSGRTCCREPELCINIYGHVCVYINNNKNDVTTLPHVLACKICHCKMMSLVNKSGDLTPNYHKILIFSQPKSLKSLCAARIDELTNSNEPAIIIYFWIVTSVIILCFCAVIRFPEKSQSWNLTDYFSLEMGHLAN